MMAIWQFRLDWLPASGLERAFGIIPRIVPHDIEVRDIWKDVHLDPSISETLDQILPRYPSWSSDICMWGSEDSDRIHVIYRDSGHIDIEWIESRIDCRNIDAGYISNICRICRSFEFILMSSNFKILELSTDAVISEIQGSSSGRYLTDPVGAILDASNSQERKFGGSAEPRTTE